MSEYIWNMQWSLLSLRRTSVNKRAKDGYRVQSFRGLLQNLGNISRSVIVPKESGMGDVKPFYVITKLTPLEAGRLSCLV